MEIEGLKENVGNIAGQVSQLMLMMEALMRKQEESSGTVEGAASRGNARESAAAAPADAPEGAPQGGSARDETYPREPVRASGPQGRQSGEAGGYDPREVRVAAAHNQGGFGSTIGSGAATAGVGFGVPAAVGAGYQSVRYTAPTFDGKAKNFRSWSEDLHMAANGANLIYITL